MIDSVRLAHRLASLAAVSALVLLAPGAGAAPRPNVGRPPIPRNNLPPPNKPATLPYEGIPKPPSGLRFAYVAGHEFVTEDPTMRKLRFPGGSLKPVSKTRRNTFHRALAKVEIPHGARVRWFDCVLDGLESAPDAVFRIQARLVRHDYSDHPFVTDFRKALIAQVSPSMTSRRGNNGKAFGEGTVASGRRTLANGAGWFEIRLAYNDTGTAYGLRGCRVGYTPP